MKLLSGCRPSGLVRGSVLLTASLLAAASLSAQGCSGEIFGGGSEGVPPDAKPGSKPGGVDDQGNPVGVEGIGWAPRFPRLSHTQWENTVRDLLRLEAPSGLASTFALDPDDKPFDTFAAHSVSANLWNDYQRAAETLARGVAGDPEALGRIVPADQPTDPEAFVRTFGGRAFRRPLTDDEVACYVALFDVGRELMDGEDEFARGAELVLTAMLRSPHFLYRIERSTEADGDRIWLDGYEIASRLSYAFWNTMPSDELLVAAGAGELDAAEGVARWARRMLEDERAAATIVSFHEQFFNVRSYGVIAKDATLFPDFGLDLQPILQEEARAYVREIAVQGDGGIAELLTRPVGFVNQRTARYYGIDGNFGESLQKVDLDPERRAGILTQLGFLSRYASQTQSDPILRGVYIAHNVLCTELPPPPNGVPPLPPIGEGQTNRERVEESTSVGACKSCHETFINPLGFAFENYDAVGQWRDTDNGKAVDAAASYRLDGELVSYANALELSRILARSPSTHACYSGKWFEYVFGRPPAEVEERVLADLADLSSAGSGIRDLLVTMPTLDTFRARPKE